MTAPLESVHRVFYLPKTLKQAMRDTRFARTQSQQELITTAIQEHLPALVETLTKLGFTPSGKKSPAKLPFHPETLEALQEASKTTTLPATSLLFLCLSAACDFTPAASSATASKPKEKAQKAVRKPRVTKGAK